MARLTEEQKVLNKEATKLRDNAYRARKSAYFKEIESAKFAPSVAAIVKATEEASSARDDMRLERANAIGALQAQIAAIQLKIEEVKKDYEAKMEPLEQARNDAWAARNKAEAEAEAAIKAKYVDVAECWSAAGWKPFEDFLPQVGQN